MKKIIGAVAGTLGAAAIAVCVVLMLTGPAVAASISANNATVTKSDGEITKVDVNIAGNVTWADFDSTPSATVRLYFGPVDLNGSVSYSQVTNYTMADELTINATSGSDSFAFNTLDLTDAAIWGTNVPSWANDGYFSASSDGSTKANNMSVKLVVTLDDGETSISKESSDSFIVTVQNLAASADYNAVATVSVS